MARFAALLVALVPLSAATADDTREKEVKAELGKLKGKWKQVSVETNGEERPVPDGVSVILTIDGDKWTIENRIGTFESMVTIDPTQNPKTLDRVRKGKDGKTDDPVEKGIYKLDKDTLTICTARTGFGGKPEDAKERPKEFKTAERGTIIVYKRLEK